MRQKRFAYVIRVDKRGNEKIYGIVECTVKGSNEPGKLFNWEFNLVRVTEAMMASYMQGMSVVNAKMKGTQVVGRNGSLTRFNEGAQAVVISKILLGNDKIIGYRVAYSSGKVLKVKANELLEQAEKNSTRGPWIQNMAYVASSGGKAGYLRELENSNIIEEHIFQPVTSSALAASYYSGDTSEATEKKLKFTEEQKEILGRAAQRGVDITLIRHPSFGPQEMKFYISEIEHGVNIKPYLSPDYNYQQLAILSEASENGLDMTKLRNPELTVQQMQEIYERLDKNIWSIDYEGNVVGAKLYSN